MKTLLAILFALFAFAAGAKDLSTLQTGVEMSRNAMEKAKAEHDADQSEVAKQKKVVAAEQRKLNAAEKKAALSKKNYLEAKAKFEKAESALDAAWK